MKLRNYKVRGLLKKGSTARQFCTTVEASSIKAAEASIRNKVKDYCKDTYPDEEAVKCIINKKTVRCDNV